VHWSALPAARRIALCNELHIRTSAALIANLTPFRGPSADAGTIYEIGFARGLGLKVFGYATVTDGFLERTLAAFPGQQAEDGAWWDPDGLLVEQFGLFDNLMIEGALAEGGGLLRDAADRWRDLTVFERCVAQAAVVLV
jgi:nucleoside 2-deoxyribosyltransferase